MMSFFQLSLGLVLGSVALAGALTDERVACDTQLEPSQVCHRFQQRTSTAINEQINMELTASYAYLAMYNYFSRDDPALYGFAKFFHKASTEETEHAKLLIDYQNLRGGKVTLDPIQTANKTEWNDRFGLEAMENALAWEHSVNQKLLDLHDIANQNNDPMTMDFLETHLLSEQLTSIKELSSYVNRLTHMTTPNFGLGQSMFDQELLNKD